MVMLMQKRNGTIEAVTDLTNVPDGTIIYEGRNSIQSSLNSNIQYHADTSDKEKLNKLEGDIDFLRSMLIDMYGKCPKMKRDFSGNKKKVNKGDDVECENCGGLLW